MAERLLGKEVAASLSEKTKALVSKLHESGITPALEIIRVGENPGDLSYERGAVKRCEATGIDVRRTVFGADADTDTLLQAIDRANEDRTVHGVLLLRPLPRSVDAQRIENALVPDKDVDGMGDLSMSGVFTGKQIGFAPCTPQAVMEILDYYGIALRGRRAVVIGRSLVFGKPASMMLLQKDATVTICHTKTQDLASIARQADILITAAGRAHTVNADFVREGQTVIDVGINLDAEGRLCGDVEYENVEKIVSAITPVPGGVGAVTTSVLAAHVAKAAMRQAKLD